ncbi:MAG TPA: CapA family protein, partial [Anaerolinea sp.]|nr:CapA family protein [Anaerolinea sp.]
MNKLTLAVVLILAAGLALSACAGTAQTGAASTPAPSNPAQATVPFPTRAPTESPALPTPIAPAPLLYLSPDLPEGFLDQVHLPAGLSSASSPDQAGLRIDLQSKTPWSTWIYALAAPFPTLKDEIIFTQLAAVWRGEPTAPDLPAHLLVDSSTYAVFSTQWGQPSERVRSLPAGQILAQSWANPRDWAILPFEQLEPRWKVIAVDGQNPLHKDFDPAAYPLRLEFGLEGDPAVIAALENDHGPATTAPLFPAGNRRADPPTTVVVTGVTALVRGTAAYMEQFGMDYPAQDILPWLRDADILHISNEIAFAENCPSPNNWSQGLAFCSQARYIQLLDDIGTDVIALAGDHFADWGQEAMYFTLNLYRERGWQVYGGGETSQAAKQPALFDHNGNKIAFIGCNYKAPGYATPPLTTPG